MTLDQIIRQLQYKIAQLEAENQKMQEKLDHVKPVVIENIHYKIQELNVSELKGTLNIGLAGELDGEQFSQLAEDDASEPDDSNSGNSETEE